MSPFAQNLCRGYFYVGGGETRSGMELSFREDRKRLVLRSETERKGEIFE